MVNGLLADSLRVDFESETLITHFLMFTVMGAVVIFTVPHPLIDIVLFLCGFLFCGISGAKVRIFLRTCKFCAWKFLLRATM